MVSTSEVERLGDSRTVLLYVYIQMFCSFIFVVAIMNVFLL